MTNELLYEHHKDDPLTYKQLLIALAVKYKEYYELDFVPNKDDMIDYIINSNFQYFDDDYDTEVRTIEFSRVGKVPEVIKFRVKELFDDEDKSVGYAYFMD